MPIAKIQLHRLRYNPDTPGRKNAYEVSRVEFTLELPSRECRGLTATITQPANADYRTVDLEVSRSLNYHGPFNFFAFRKAVEAYYRDAMATRHARQGRYPKIGDFIYERGLTFACEVTPGKWSSIAWNSFLAVSTETDGLAVINEQKSNRHFATNGVG